MSKQSLYLIALICWIILMFNWFFNRAIVSTPIGFIFIISLFLITGLSIGIGLGKKG